MRPGSPRWEHTDRALSDQLALEAEGCKATIEPGHAAVRYTNPTTGDDVMPTLRSEFHRLAPGTETAPVREVGSSVFQVFDGTGEVTVAWQFRTRERLQGKTFEGTTPLGPVLVTPGELPGGVRPSLPITCRVALPRRRLARGDRDRGRRPPGEHGEERMTARSWMDRGTGLFLATVDRLSDGELDAQAASWSSAAASEA
ncbi:hypothetical protein [Planomonospora corallina]